MHQDKNGVPVPWDAAFEQDAEKYPLLRLAIHRWYSEMDGDVPVDALDAYQEWAYVTCRMMRDMARRLEVYHPNRNPLSNR